MWDFSKNLIASQAYRARSFVLKVYYAPARTFSCDELQNSLNLTLKSLS